MYYRMILFMYENISICKVQNAIVNRRDIEVSKGI